MVFLNANFPNNNKQQLKHKIRYKWIKNGINVWKSKELKFKILPILRVDREWNEIINFAFWHKIYLWRWWEIFTILFY